MANLWIILWAQGPKPSQIRASSTSIEAWPAQWPNNFNYSANARFKKLAGWGYSHVIAFNQWCALGSVIHPCLWTLEFLLWFTNLCKQKHNKKTLLIHLWIFWSMLSIFFYMMVSTLQFINFCGLIFFTNNIFCAYKPLFRF